MIKKFLSPEILILTGLKGIDLHKVLRGGSYYTIAKYCKITNRYGVNPLRWDIDYGLRLVISFQDNTEEKRVAQ